jgi:DNA-binding CsgD family transcriptional regulator
MRFRDKKAGVLPLISSYFPCQKLLSELNDSKIGIVVCDRRFRYKALNRTIAEIHNVPIEALLGHSFYQALGRLAEKVVPVWEKVFATGQPLTYFEVTGQLPKRSGAAHWVEKVFPLRDSKGRITQVGGFVIEVPPTPMINFPPSSPTQRAIALAGDQPSSPDRPRHILLSHREQEVLRLLAEGKSTKEISSVLIISNRTVEKYRARLKLKLDVNSIVDLVRYAIRNHVVSL